MSVWRNRIVGLTQEIPEDLLAHPANPRRHPGIQRDALRGSLDELGWVAPVIVNDRTGMVVDGHARIEEAITAGAPIIPVVHIDVSVDEEHLILAVLDPISSMAKLDGDRLEDLLASIDTDNQALNDLMASLTGEDVDGTPITTPSPAGDANQKIVLTFDDADDYAEFCGGLSLVPGNGITDKLLRLVRNAIT